MNSDNNIWKDFKNGDRYALSYIYYQNVQFLFRYGKKFSKDDGLIRDSIQDLFFDLIKTRENLGETNNIKFYLMVSLRRKLALNVKKQIKKTEINETMEFNSWIDNSMEDEVIKNEERNHKLETINKALKKLSARQREALFYRFYWEFEYKQICEIMDLKYDSARRLISRALKSLKTNLSEKDILLFCINILSSD